MPPIGRYVKKIAAAFLLGCLLLIGIIAFRTASLRSHQIVPSPATLPPIDGEAAARRLAQTLRIRTISADEGPADTALFAELRASFEAWFPRVHTSLRREIIGGSSLLYTWTGTDPAQAPILLAAHLDVVPVPADTVSQWTHPPFDGVIADGFVWGRGALDNKSSAMAMLEAAELLIGEGFTPKRTIYLAFGHDEEIGGPRGAQAMAAALRERGVRLAFALDEGMVIVDGVIPGLKAPAALIGIAEKGSVSIELGVKDEAGHSSMPPATSAIGTMSAAVHALENTPMPAAVAGPIRHMFEYLAPEMPWLERAVFANLWLLESAVISQLEGAPSTNAAIRTTTALTMFHAGVKSNVLPKQATAVVNFRIQPGDTITSVLDHARAAIDNERVTIRQLPDAREPSSVSPHNSPEFTYLHRTVKQVFPQVVVAPALCIGGTDGYHYSALTPSVLRLQPIVVAGEDLKRFHGVDERISLDAYTTMIGFYYQLFSGSF